ncbi:MAG: PKD domain-containing protein [Candidatus Bathyarchaeia archaeon]
MRSKNVSHNQRHACLKTGLLIVTILLSTTWLITNVHGSWSPVTIPITQSLSGISMVSTTEGWAVGSGGIILKLSGGTWSVIPSSPVTTNLLSVSMVSSGEGWAVGASGAILRCTGGSWSNYTSSPVTNYLYSVSMTSPTDGWAVGASGAILRCTGGSWSNYTSSPVTNYLYSVSMTSPTDGWAVGASGAILRCTGGTWNRVTSIPTTNTLYSVNMVSATDGWAVGSGVTLHWDGATWNLITPSPTTQTLQAVSMVSANEGWAVGYSAMMIHWVKNAPVASFTYSPSNPTVNTAVSFDASASNDSDGTIANYAWDFGDGNTGTGVTTSHTYPIANTYTVNLTVTDNTGLKGTLSKNIIVTSGIVSGVTASASPSNANATVGQSATFTANASGGAGGYQYQWYRNGETMAGQNLNTLSVEELTSGTYKYYCIIKDSENQTAQSNEVTLTVTSDVIVINGGTETANSTSVTLTLSASGIMSNVTQMCFSNNNVGWSAWEPYSTTKQWTLTAENGTKTVYAKFKNGAGDISDVYQDSITLAIAQEAAFPWMLVTAIIIIVIIVAVIVILLLLKRRKPPAPAQLRITAEPAILVADGQTKSVITMQLLDKKGKPIPAITDTQINISATQGKLENAVVTIPKGKDAEKTVIVSSTETGQVPVSANAEGLKSITVTLNFVEKNRYCMHCGTQMATKAKACPNCGKMPLAGVDTKSCPNCEAVIPIAAKFCNECGAGQAA